jgi:hypothetical protein
VLPTVTIFEGDTFPDDPSPASDDDDADIEEGISQLRRQQQDRLDELERMRREGTTMPRRRIGQAERDFAEEIAEEKGLVDPPPLVEDIEAAHPLWFETMQDRQSRTNYEEDEIQAFRDYSSYGNEDINAGLLRAGGVVDAMTSEADRHRARLLSEAIARHPIRSEPLEVWRGIRSHPDYIADVAAEMTQLGVGSEIVLESFASTSQQRLIGEAFARLHQDEGNVLWKVRTYSGANLGRVSTFNYEEAEILLNVGSRYRVTAPYNPATRVIELEEVLP